MNFLLTDEQRQLIESVRRFANQSIRAVAHHVDIEHKMNPKVFAQAAELGLPLDAVPAARGGYLDGAFSHLNRALRDEILGWGCAAIAHQIESIVDVALLLAKAPAHVQSTWFKRIVDAGYARAAVMGWRDGFSAKVDNRRVLIQGHETAILLADSAQVWLVRANGLAGTVLALFAGKPQACETFAVSHEAWRGCDVADVHLYEAPVDDVIAQGADADALWQLFLDGARLSIAARGIGVAQAAIEFAQQYGAERIQFGRPIIKFQALAQMAAENQAAINAARQWTLQLATRLDAGESVSNEIRRLKAHVAQMLFRATIDAVQMLGGYGFVSDYPVEKYYRDARVFDSIYGRDMLDLLIEHQAA